ncbi:lipid II flippase MurJ [Actinomadura macra]|uniref:lipid II flippase MurJ n=1 Tax=Actinomadura macra TaxID=46164 RepID=UPI0008295A81|nr:lipid II flippase MurJ [Actinomadura macra]
MTATDAAPRASSIGRAAALSGVLIAGGTVLGFLRDLAMAHLFGASGSTDAFLVAWTIPETVSPLLIEDAMALLMVPAITRLLAGGEGVRPFVGATLPRLVAVLAAVAVTLAVGAPVLVHLLAPGLPEPGPAVECVRLTAVTVVTFGIAGFMSATLRAHHRFGPPAAIYLAYNVGILTLIAGFSGAIGITSAAVGVACGSVLMVVVQAPAFLRCLREAPAPPGRADELRLGLAAVAPIVVYTVTRQAQVFVERFLGSGLTAGSISHLNYAQKVAQVPMVLSLLIVTVTFPRLARASADGDTGQIARRIQRDLVVVSGMVLCAAAYLVAFAPVIVEVLFEHGEFTSADTGSTAAIMRVYALGLWGQSTVGLAARAFFAHGRPTWRPAAVLATGLAVTAAIGAALAAVAGAVALAAANAAGITVAAVLLLLGLRLKVAPIPLRRIGADIARLVLVAAGSGAAGLLAAAAFGIGQGTGAPAIVPAVAGGVVTVATFAALIAVAGRGLIASWITAGPPGGGPADSGRASEPADRRTDPPDRAGPAGRSGLPG